MKISTQKHSIKGEPKRVSASPYASAAHQWYIEKLTNKDDFCKHITTFPFYIGRNETCELALSGQYVSKFHAEIVREGNLLRLVDLGSVNGTYVNRMPIKESVLLKSGDVIHFSRLLDDNAGFRIVSRPPEESNAAEKKQVSQNYKAQRPGLIESKKFVRGEDFDLPPVLTFSLEVQNKELRQIRGPVSDIDKGVSLTLEVPSEQDIDINPKDTCIARFSSDGRVYGFKTKIINIELVSVTLSKLILQYPEVITYIAYRRFTRYKTNLDASIRKTENDIPVECRVVDISLGGCKISFKDNLPNLNGKVLLSIDDIVEGIHVSKVHERKTSFDYQVGFEILYFGGHGKMKKFEEILHFHAPIWA